MRITFRCPPELQPVLPPPVAAAACLPPWLKSMPGTAFDPDSGTAVRTLKHCPPLIDALGLGYLILLPADLQVGPGPSFIWDWSPPPTRLPGLPRSPVSFHAAAQGEGAGLAPPGRRFLKFLNFWTIETEPGVSVLTGHPFNRHDLPFTTLTGMIDTDLYGAGLVHFPAVWHDDDFVGVLPRGTPVAQLIPLRREPLDATVSVLDEPALQATEQLRHELDAQTGVYRKRFRARRDGTG